MSKVKYNANRHIQVLKIDDENFSLVKSGECKVGDYVVSKIGMFHKDLRAVEGISIVIDGICKDPKWCEKPFYKVVDKATADKVYKEIIQAKNKASATEIELARAKEEIEALKKTNTKLEQTSKTTSSK